MNKKCNVGLNFANDGEANNFKNEVEKKLRAKQQRRQGNDKVDIRTIILFSLEICYTKGTSFKCLSFQSSDKNLSD